MPTNRTPITRTPLGELSDVMRRYFLEEEYDKEESIEIMATPERRQRLLWEQHQDELLREYIETWPCSRPGVWWQWSAPRASDTELLTLGYLPTHYDWPLDKRPCSPRRRLGGVGRVPVRQRLVHGLPDLVRDVDWSDPPRYESEASYLQRFNLLFESEIEIIAKHPIALEPVECVPLEIED